MKKADLEALSVNNVAKMNDLADNIEYCDDSIGDLTE